MKPTSSSSFATAVGTPFARNQEAIRAGQFGIAPDEQALPVVELALEHLGARQVADIRGGAHVVGVHVGDHDPPHLEARELLGPALFRIREPEPGVDERPAVLALEQVRVDMSRPARQGERHTQDSVIDPLGNRRHGTSIAETGAAGTRLRRLWLRATRSRV